ncbi:hypothetical protein AVEN_76362-1 [Araneus ventricosus]|uniref:Uncharacterized protein n=1 Tax=Araneus ventricosus TaxID=182803 RepID=A0A4Y2KL91_ARAVE|nr:hypothetical protein AVEN_76362-1 [Araneus ventricosus]
MWKTSYEPGLRPSALWMFQENPNVLTRSRSSGQFQTAVTDILAKSPRKVFLWPHSLTWKWKPFRWVLVNETNPRFWTRNVIATCDPVVDIVARPQEFSRAQHLQSTLENLQMLNERRTTNNVKDSQCQDLFFRPVTLMSAVAIYYEVYRVKSSPGKIKAVVGLAPSDVKYMTSEFPWAVHISSFVKDFYNIETLHKLTEAKSNTVDRVDVKSQWFKAGFDIFSPIFDLLTRFILDTDASNEGIEPVLSEYWKQTMSSLTTSARAWVSQKVLCHT